MSIKGKVETKDGRIFSDTFAQKLFMEFLAETVV
jgi:hypothetical protein